MNSHRGPTNSLLVSFDCVGDEKIIVSHHTYADLCVAFSSALSIFTTGSLNLVLFFVGWKLPSQIFGHKNCFYIKQFIAPTARPTGHTKILGWWSGWVGRVVLPSVPYVWNTFYRSTTATSCVLLAVNTSTFIRSASRWELIHLWEPITWNLKNIFAVTTLLLSAQYDWLKTC